MEFSEILNLVDTDADTFTFLTLGMRNEEVKITDRDITYTSELARKFDALPPRSRTKVKFRSVWRQGVMVCIEGHLDIHSNGIVRLIAKDNGVAIYDNGVLLDTLNRSVTFEFSARVARFDTGPAGVIRVGEFLRQSRLASATA